MHLPPFLAGLLREHLDVHRYPYVFTGGRGGWLRRSAFRKQVRPPALAEWRETEAAASLARECGPMTFHGLRRTHKTWMAEHHTPPSMQGLPDGACPHAGSPDATSIPPSSWSPDSCVTSKRAGLPWNMRRVRRWPEHGPRRGRIGVCARTVELSGRGHRRGGPPIGTRPVSTSFRSAPARRLALRRVLPLRRVRRSSRPIDLRDRCS